MNQIVPDQRRWLFDPEYHAFVYWLFQLLSFAGRRYRGITL